MHYSISAVCWRAKASTEGCVLNICIVVKCANPNLWFTYCCITIGSSRFDLREVSEQRRKSMNGTGRDMNKISTLPHSGNFHQKLTASQEIQQLPWSLTAEITYCAFKSCFHAFHVHASVRSAFWTSWKCEKCKCRLKIECQVYFSLCAFQPCCCLRWLQTSDRPNSVLLTSSSTLWEFYWNYTRTTELW